MSVLLKEVVLKPSQFENEDHLRGRVFRAVRHKILDRVKSAGAKAIHGIAEDVADRRHEGHGVESSVAEEELSRRVRAILLAGLKPEDQVIVESCVLDDIDRAEVGRRIGLAVSAVRKRLERLRPGLRDRLLDLARGKTQPADWEVAHALLAERLSPDACAARFGLSRTQLEGRVQAVMLHQIGPVLGLLGQTALLRLLGRSRGETD